MDIFLFVEAASQLRVAAQMSQQPQFDLRIVGGQKSASRRGDERRADFAAGLRLDGDVLKVRVAR